MSTQWNFYSCQINDNPASIYVDLALRAQAPLQNYPVLFRMRIELLAPSDAGLSSQEEFDDLMALEDLIVAAATKNGHMKYVGRCTTNGHREFFSYAHNDELDEADLEHAMAVFPAYQWDGELSDDPNWEAYQQFLLPNALELEQIKNRNLCNALAEHGDALTAVRPIYHWAYFDTNDAAQAFASHIANLGYQVLYVIAPDTETTQYCVKLSAMGVPSYENIDTITFPVFTVANECGGNYDGWETEIIAK